MKKSFIWALVVMTTMAMTLPSKGWAMLAPAQFSNEGSGATAARAADLKTIQTALESKVIRQRFMELKLSPEQIDSRLSKLSDDQVHQTAMQIRTSGPGGDSGDFLITVLLIGVLVALFMYIFKRI